jgi:UDP-2-acetamido-3-amino-2,3-dideoxy-glucuronate N-acetyltransferase
MAQIENTQQTGVAVIGSGYWGKNLVRNFYQLNALKLICDNKKSVLNNFRQQYPDVETCLDVSDALKRDDIKAVAIATPAETHFELVKEFLLAGKDVFVEKPLALTEEEGGELVKLAEHNHRILMVGHILHYHPAVTRLKELVDAGELGKLQYLYSNRLNIGKIRAEENILWSFAPHDISMILMLLGEMPESLYATGGSYLQNHIPDTTMTTMDFPSRVKAHIFVSWLHPFKEQKLVVVGSKKMAVFNDMAKDKLLLYPHEIEWVDRIPVASKKDYEVVSTDTSEPLKAECSHFLDCLKNRRLPKTDGREGLRVLKILQASQASIDRNGSTINFYPDSSSKPTYRTRRPAASNRFRQDRENRKEKYFTHESAYIDENTAIGEGTKIWHFSHILSGSSIGAECNIGQNAVIGPDVSIGDRCKIQNNVSIYKGVTLEDGVFCGPSTVFTNVNTPRAEIKKMDQLQPTLLQKGATIGANATIVCGITIGRSSFVGAGAVVTKNVPAHALVTGNPAKQSGWMCRCGERLPDNLECNFCNDKYQFKANNICKL